MKARDHRPTLLRGVDAAPRPDKTKPETLLTPRWISPHSLGGRLILKMSDREDELPQRVPNRSERRANARAVRREQKAAMARVMLLQRRIAERQARRDRAAKKAA